MQFPNVDGRRRAVLSVTVLLITGCSGAIATPDAPAAAGDRAGTNGSPSGRGGAVGTGGSGPATPATMPLRRLNAVEYANTARALLGSANVPDPLPLGEDAVSAVGYAQPGIVGDDDVSAYYDAAALLATRATASLAQLVPCSAGVTAAGEAACARSFVRDFGRRAYRRPLTDAEAMRLDALYATARSDLGHGFGDAVRVVLQAMLQSPFFLYHWELGATPAHAEAGVVRLGGYELASRLSYFLWSSMPDDELLAAAGDGSLLAEGGVAKQVRRMLSDARAGGTLGWFHRQWLGVAKVEATPKDTSAFPSFTPALAHAMRTEVETFADQVVRMGDGRLETLLSAPYSWIDGALAATYGLTGVAAASSAEKRTLPSGRAGLLTTPAFLATHATDEDSHPVKRGLLVFQRLLCGEVPPPPQVIPQLMPPAPGVTNRQRFSQHSSAPACAACHAHMDPIGFAFEGFDAIGRARTTQGGAAIDTTGTLDLPSGDKLSFTDARDLATQLAKTDDVRACTATQWFRFAFARREEPADEASLAQARAAFADAGWDVRALVTALATSRAFAYRAPAEQEVLR